MPIKEKIKYYKISSFELYALMAAATTLNELLKPFQKKRMRYAMAIASKAERVVYNVEQHIKGFHTTIMPFSEGDSVHMKQSRKSQRKKKGIKE